jgi:hypothetical protein
LSELLDRRWVCLCPDCHHEWCTYREKPWFTKDEDWPKTKNILDLRCPRCEQKHVQKQMREEHRLLLKFKRGPKRTLRSKDQTLPLPFYDDARGVQSSTRAVHA